MFEVYGTKFDIDERYQFVKALGKGAYGVVCSVRDVKSNRKLAIKKICPMAKSVYDAKHTLREIRLLRHCGQHPNVITLHDLMVNELTDELYIGMECMDTDLHRIIQSSQKLSISHHKHFMHQLILGIEFLHSNGILHRDLKPANLLVSKNCDLRISDFGLARRAPEATDDKPLMTEHVVTRWYRPPELMLSPDGKYTAAVDVWSCGCIFAELLGRTPLFPGKNFVHQLQLIFDVIGTPDPRETTYIKNSQAIQFLRSLPNKGAVDLASIYPHATSDAIDFMAACIRFSAGKRISIKDALEHPFFNNAPLRDKKIDVPRLDEKLFNFDFEQQDFNEKQLREIIINEVTDFTITNNLRPLSPQKYTRHKLYLGEVDARWQQKQGRREKERRSRDFSQDEDMMHDEADLLRQAKKKKSSSRAMSARPTTTYAEPNPSTKGRPHSAHPYVTTTSSLPSRRHRAVHDADEEDRESDAMEEDASLGPSRSSRMQAGAAHLTRRMSTSSSSSTSSSVASSPTASSRSSRRGKSKSDYEQSTERENEAYGNTVATPSNELRQTKKKSRSFTSRILGSSSILSSSRSSKGDKLPSVHRTSSFSKKKPSGVNTAPTVQSSSSRQDNASPMSCDSGSPISSSNMVEEHKYESVSSMLPIKNILRKSKRHLQAGQYDTTDMIHSGRGGTVSSSSSSSSAQQSQKVRNVTVPQPFSFSHPRNKERIGGY